MTNPLNSLISPAAIGEGLSRSFWGGMERGDKMREREREREARSAMSEWLLSQGGPRTNALMGVPPPGAAAQAPAPGQPGALNDLMAVPGAQTSTMPQPSALGALTAQAGGAPTAPGSPRMPAQPMATPQRAASQSTMPSGPEWERYVRADPSGAMKSLLEKQNLTKAQNEALFTQMDMLSRLARGAVDQPSYEAAIQRAQGMGIDTSSLPAKFDPAAVNAVELQAMSAKEYLTEQRNDRRVDWDVQDDEADNERADRDVNDRIDDRSERRTLTRRGQDLSDSRARRGQDIADERGRRGQDLANDRGRRGQDLTDTRGRRGQDMGGRKPARGAKTGDGAVIVNPQTGQRMKLQGGKWVPVA